ncbi:MAG: VanZ family protein [Nitrospinota bacterium]
MINGRRLSFRRIDTLVLLLYSGLIFYLSSRTQPVPFLAPFAIFPHADKVFHATEYALLASLWLGALRRAGVGGPEAAAPSITFAICVLYALSDEFFQGFIPGRSSSAGDLLADGTGAALAIGIWQGLRARRLSPAKEGNLFRRGRL